MWVPACSFLPGRAVALGSARTVLAAGCLHPEIPPNKSHACGLQDRGATALPHTLVMEGVESNGREVQHDPFCPQTGMLPRLVGRSQGTLKA